MVAVIPPPQGLRPSPAPDPRSALIAAALGLAASLIYPIAADPELRERVAERLRHAAEDLVFRLETPEP